MQPLQTHLCDWQDWDGSQAKLIYHCMVPGIELDWCATGHTMSNQQSEKKSFQYTTQKWIGAGFTKLVATYNFAASRFCTA